MQNPIEKLFSSKLVLINVGTRLFGDAAKMQGCEVIQVDWQPPVTVDEDMSKILEDLGF